MTEENKESQNKFSWNKFLQETSLHGCMSIFKYSEFKVKRYVWSFIMLGTLVAWIYLSAWLVINIKEKPVRTVYKVEYKQPILFPTLTLCVICPLRVTSATLPSDIIEAINANSDWLILKNGNSSKDLKYTQRVQDTFKTVKMKDVFLQVTFQGEILEPTSVFQELSNTESSCFVFNGAKYQAANGSFVSNYVGFSKGLDIIADTHQSDCPGGIYLHDGLEIYVHSKDGSIPSSSPDVLLSPGTTTNIGLTKRQTRFLPKPYKSVSDWYCNPAVNYSRSQCIESCVKKKLIEICPCSVYNNIIDQLQNVSKDCYSNMVRTYICQKANLTILYNQAESKQICDCDYPCTLTQYYTEQSHSYFPNEAVSKRLVDLGLIPNISYARKNILKFSMNYKRLAEDIMEYVPEHSTESVIGTIGGTLGFFLGASLITLIEVLEAVARFALSILKRKSPPQQPTQTKVEPFTN